MSTQFWAIVLAIAVIDLALLKVLRWMDKRISKLEADARVKGDELRKAFANGKAVGWLERQDAVWADEKKRRTPNGQFKSPRTP